MNDIQFIFSLNTSIFIQKLYEKGYKITLGEAWRPQETQEIYLKRGKSKTKNSKHLIRLAIDLNLFKNGKLLVKTEDYKEAGELWKSLNEKNIWGGDWGFDGNHFEMSNK